MNSVISFPVNALKANEHFLAQDIYNTSGVMIARKDSMITKKIIVKLNLHNVETVMVKKFNTSDIPTVDPVDFEIEFDPKNQYENIREFEENYNEVADQIKNNFKEIEEGKEILPGEIKKIGEDIINHLSHSSNIFSYLSFMKSQDSITFKHCLNVSIISQIFGKFLDMDDDEIELLATCALLHDIGKTKIEPELIYKPGPLSNDEVSTLQNHVLHSYKMIENHNLPQSIKLGVLMHHERVDGSGYIMHYKGDQIHKFAKIISIIDIYEAMTQERPYRKKIVPLDALQYIKSISVSKLDYSLANKFITMTANSYKDTKVKLSTGHIGEIVFINPKAVNKPLVKVDGTIIDLSQEVDVKITDAY